MAERVPVAVLLSGRGSNMRALVQASRQTNCPFRIVLVASDRPDAAGLTWARAEGIDTFALAPKGIGKAAFEAALDDALKASGARVIALAGYMRLVSDAFVERWRNRIINIHPSLLPKYKGLDTHARAIAAGDTVAGCSVHIVNEELDGGALLGQAEVPIRPGDTPDILAERVLEQEHRLYPRVLAEYVRHMTDHPALLRLRDIVQSLPDVEERTEVARTRFLVGDKPFAELLHDNAAGDVSVRLRAAADDRGVAESGQSAPTDQWVAVSVGDDSDWTALEERVVRAWELAAPAALLEAGGR
ncbi:phosphoribosylglycinamide formyltransferase-1 [Sphingomonas gellani]|uniref:Phosphoribosylglycinamide formyltransferase n=1 Tax=Sphingomonas gellani TaxID=1166340 RepID=A0A1H7ZRF1_9SPHN|nr:phosphoribosylglycinamide formyltransferase [Sphingomonas gellani]SEM61005.1 phosphoribosylglycinamide formyltransferase-1 [Sphingomonas gellani]